MKISVTQENLAKALNHILKATAVKPNIPVLANVLIQTERGKIKFSATNLDVAVTTWIGGDVAEEGEVTVNARLLTEFVSQLKGTRVELIQSGQSLEVKSVDNQAQLFIIPSDDFPTLPDATGEANLVLNAQEFANAVEKTVVAAAIDQSRPVLTGLLLESTQRRLSLVGVDGFRLARKILKLTKANEDDLKLVVPAKALQELCRIIMDSASSEDTLNIFWLKEKSQIIFKVNEVIFSSRLLEGEFPDYKEIIPSDSQVEAVVAKPEFAAAIKIASIFARNVLGYKTYFKIAATDKKLQLAAKVQDMGNNESALDLAKVSGEDYETAYNAKFLQDMINTMTGDEVNFSANGITAPGVFTTKEDEDYLHIIMPMRIE